MCDVHVWCHVLCLLLSGLPPRRLSNQFYTMCDVIKSINYSDVIGCHGYQVVFIGPLTICSCQLSLCTPCKEGVDRCFEIFFYMHWHIIWNCVTLYISKHCCNHSSLFDAKDWIVFKSHGLNDYIQITYT